VTIATALALPQSFPERDMLLFAAFMVTLGTLLIQGLTLRPLVLALRLPEDDTVDQEVQKARLALAKAALASIADEASEEAVILRAELQAEQLRVRVGDDVDPPVRETTRVRAKALTAQRAYLLAMRAEGVIGDDAFQRVEEDLDFSEIALRTRR